MQVHIVGDSGVGKTNIVLRFTEDTYKNSHTATIGVDFKIKTVNVNSTKIRLQVWIQQANVNLETLHEPISRVQPMLSSYLQLMIENPLKY